MKGDFSRNSFDPAKHFLRVLMQQGRVQLDADWNEQTAILLHYLQKLAADVFGRAAGTNGAFEIDTPASGDFEIGKGHYYVDGILCENDDGTTYLSQPDFQVPRDLTASPVVGPPDLPKDLPYLVYLDVWERHITYVEDADIREIALDGPDTAIRSKVVWQVKAVSIEKAPTAAKLDDYKSVDFLEDLKKNAIVPGTGQLRAGTGPPPKDSGDPCTIAASSAYRGAENLLYRVEIHQSGKAWDEKPDTKMTAATFKWSRDNGSIIFPIKTLAGQTATLAHLGRDPYRTLKTGDWVEAVDDGIVLRGEPGPLLQVHSVDRARMLVTFEPATATLPAYDEKSTLHPLLRRWDRDPNDKTAIAEIQIVEADPAQDPDPAKPGWITLENNVQVRFEPQTPAANYRTGDYWLIPARVTSGGVLWPSAADGPKPVTPHGVQHHYAPLAIIDKTGSPIECRRIIKPAI